VYNSRENEREREREEVRVRHFARVRTVNECVS